MDTHTILILGHIIGTILGVGGATFIEMHLNMSLQDNKMDDTEKRMMAKDFLLTRIGMFVGFVTGMGFIIEYAIHNQLFRLMDGVFWAKMTIFCIIIINAYLLHKHKVGLYWGSAFSFISWWTVMLLGVFLTNNVKFFPGNPVLSFITVFAIYVLAVCLSAPILHKLRELRKITPDNLAPTNQATQK